MSFSALIFASRSISDDMIFCAGWAEVQKTWGIWGDLSGKTLVAGGFV